MEENRPDSKNVDGWSDRESLRVQKTAYLRRQLAKRRQEEDAQWERLVQEQHVIDRLREDMDGDMDWMEESRRYHQNLKEDLNAQIYALHGVSADKLEGMREYGQAYYRGCAAILFVLSAALFVLCGVFYGFQAEITLSMLACTATGGALLSQEGKRVRALEWLCRFLYLLLFPCMLFLFICHMRGDPLYELCLPYMSMAGMGLTVLGVVSGFLYNPYRQIRRKFNRAKKQIAEIEREAEREVRRNQKTREKQERRSQKSLAREERHMQKVQEREENRSIRRREKEERRRRKAEEREARRRGRIPEREDSGTPKDGQQEESKKVRISWSERKQRFLERLHKKKNRKTIPEVAAEPSGQEEAELSVIGSKEERAAELPVIGSEEERAAELPAIGSKEKGEAELPAIGSEEKAGEAVGECPAGDSEKKTSEGKPVSDPKEGPAMEPAAGGSI